VGAGFGKVRRYFKISALEQISLGLNREDSQRVVNERVYRH
jgi:hypothetical protein